MQRPRFYFLVRQRLRRELLNKGYARWQANEMLDELDDDVIDDCAAEVDPSSQAIGDGSLIDAITKFLNSELGKALISLLLKLLIGI